ACGPDERRVLDRQLRANLHCVPTSSMGRLFDAVAALPGGRQTVTYEAQAAIEMEAVAETATGEGAAYSFSLTGEPLVIDPGGVLRAVIADCRAGTPAAVVAARFHGAVAQLIVELAEQLRRRTGIDVVGLSGGVFQNVLLLRLVVPRLKASG